MQNFFKNEGIRLPRGTEILIAPVTSSRGAYDNHLNESDSNEAPNFGSPVPYEPYVPDLEDDSSHSGGKLEKKYPCSQCDKAFSTKLFLETHIRLHTLESLPEHQLSLERELGLQRESMHVLPSKDASGDIFACPVCDKTFNMKRYLSNHLRSHNMKLVESDPSFNGESYTCQQCQKSYTKKASFIAHMKAHDDRPFKCEICSRLFREVNSLNVHRSLHSSNSKHQCTVCGLFFRFRSQLKIHEWTHSNNKFTCKFCGKIFRNYFSCKSHENNHVNGKQFICSFCEKTFKYKVALKTHLLTHTRPYKCDSCNRTFDNSAKLQNHKKNHLFEKFQLDISESDVDPLAMNGAAGAGYVKLEPGDDDGYPTNRNNLQQSAQGLEQPEINFLPECGPYDESAKSETVVDDCVVGNLQLHFLEGGNEPNDGSIRGSENCDDQNDVPLYSCQYCKIDFKQLEEFQGHMASHEGKHDLNCKHCGQIFKRFKKLEKHLRKHNEYKCERCIKSFETEAELLQHTIYHKDESFKCNYCESMFTNKYTLQYHIKRHLKRYRCKYCPKSFDNENQLETHIASHQSVYKCDFCDKDFKFNSLLLNHLKIHTRQYKCDRCDRSFDKSITLTRHQRNAHAPSPFICHVCERSFNYESAFNSHLRSHNRQYQCVYCLRSFDDEHCYNKHVRRHEMKFTELKCDKCDKKFKYYSQLQVHIKNHGNVYRCEECNIELKHWKSLEKHNRLLHSSDTPSTSTETTSEGVTTTDPPSTPATNTLKCPKCGKQFKYNSQLLLHLKNHKNVHRCEPCDMQFKNYRTYQKHVRTEHEQIQEYACTLCEAKFKYQSQLKHHAESHNRKYACECGKTFNSKKYFVSHRLTHTVDSLKCDFCDKQFKYYSTLKIHLKSHQKDSTFQCFHCERVFKTKWKIQRHIENVHLRENKVLACQTCNKTFKYLSQLKLHSAQHEKTYSCKLCDRSFNNRRYYLFHKNKHAAGSSLTCHHCSKSFKYNSQLRIHMKSHVNGKKSAIRTQCSWNCNLCGKRFKFRSLLKNHMMIHEGVKPYQCNYCGKRFAWKSSLQIHSSFVHKHKTRFYCESCDRYFFYESQYKQHMSTCQWDVSFNCKYCDKQLKSRKTYELHLLKHEGTKQFICAYCEKAFYTKQVLLNHIKSHLERETKTCPVCNQQFTSEFRYNSHVQNHYDEFRCDICDKVFKCKYKMKRHFMTTHQPNSTYSCQHCGKLFLRESALINHQATHFGAATVSSVIVREFGEESFEQYETYDGDERLPDKYHSNAEQIDCKPDLSELGILVPEVIYENHF